MKIKDMLGSENTPISFEIFPPKTDYPIETIYNTLDQLKDSSPDFISVTYGQGGSAKGQTIEIASRVKRDYGIESIAHLTCVTSTRDTIQKSLQDIRDNNMENILALRGDIPPSYLNNPNWKPEYRYAYELVDEIREFGGFCIGAACYPEGHIETRNKVEDLKYLKQKVDHGVDFLFTQLFFDNELFYQFREKLDLVGIDKPVIAGILPVLNIRQIKHIQEISGCNLPPKFMRILDRYEHDPVSLQEAGIAYAVDQIIDLLSSGIEGIHIYTMNKPDPTRRILESIANVRYSGRKRRNNQ